MQPAVLLHFEPHLKHSNAVGGEAEAKRPHVPETPEPTRLADVRILALSLVALATVLVPSLHASMSDVELSVAETSTSLLMTRWQITMDGNHIRPWGTVQCSRNSSPKYKPHHSDRNS